MTKPETNDDSVTEGFQDFKQGSMWSIYLYLSLSFSVSLGIKITLQCGLWILPVVLRCPEMEATEYLSLCLT